MNIDDLIREAKKYSPINEGRIRDAYDFAQKAHAGQTRMSGEPYISHPLGVAMILAEYKADEESLVAALLHDVVEDTPHTLNEIEKFFGKNIAKMVDSLTKLSHVNAEVLGRVYEYDNRIESIRKVFAAMEEDVRVIVIKLCDRLHNIQSLSAFRPDKQKRIAQETFDIYVKIADRLSIGDLRDKLEEESIRYLFPEEYNVIQKKKNEQTKFAEKNKKIILDNIQTHPHSKKIQDITFRTEFPYSNLIDAGFDVFDFKYVVYVLFPTEEDCYLGLRDIHYLWKNVRTNFKDYISLPKSNGYKALETMVLGQGGEVLKFIIQTPEMYMYSRYGVIMECFKSTHHGKKVQLQWVESLKRIHRETKQKSGDYMMALENDILKGSIIVYTSDNKTLFLPPESTALDAAFFSFEKKAKYVSRIFVNDKLRGFSTFLQDGDKIRFEMASYDVIDYTWVSRVNTAYSKSVIFDIINDMDRQKKIGIGERILQEELNRRGLGYIDEIDEKNIRKLFKDFNIQTSQDLYISVATGKIPGSKVAEIIFSSTKEVADKTAQYSLEMELLPGRYDALSSLLKILDQKKITLNNLKFLPANSHGLILKAEISLPYSYYDPIIKSLHGLTELRFISLKDLKRIKVGNTLLALLIILVALDPVIAYLLLHNVEIHPYDLLTIRFLSIFLVSSFVLFLKKIRSGHVEETEISINNRYFSLSVIALFSTAFFTYLALNEGGSPFFYQFMIYALFFPFMAVQLKQYSNLRIFIYILYILILFAFYLLYLFIYGEFNLNYLIFTSLVSISFIVYTQSSITFQREQHIHLRYLSFFKILSFYATIISIIPHFFMAEFTFPSLLQIGLAIIFSILFIYIPYILYFIITGIHGYTISLWRKIIFLLPVMIAGEMLILGFDFQGLEIMMALLFITGYFVYSSAFRSTEKTTPFV